MAIQINTASVIDAATSIEKKNQTIRDEFPKVEAEIRQLGNIWESSVSRNACRRFQSLKSTFYQRRYDTVDDLVRFLRYQVAENYERTEEALSAAAAAFK